MINSVNVIQGKAMILIGFGKEDTDKQLSDQFIFYFMSPNDTIAN